MLKKLHLFRDMSFFWNLRLTPLVSNLDTSIDETYFSLGSANETLLCALFQNFKIRASEASKYLLTLENLFFKNPRPLKPLKKYS